MYLSSTDDISMVGMMILLVQRCDTLVVEGCSTSLALPRVRLASALHASPAHVLMCVT